MPYAVVECSVLTATNPDSALAHVDRLFDQATETSVVSNDTWAALGRA
jgi:hypothetical protein